MPIIKLLGSSLYIHSQPLLHHFPNILWITSFHNPYLCVEIQWTVTLRMNIHIKCTHHSTYLWIVLYIYIYPYTILFLPSRIDENDGILRHLQIDGLWSTLSAFGLLPSVPSVVDPKVPPPPPKPGFPTMRRLMCSFHLNWWPLNQTFILSNINSIYYVSTSNIIVNIQ